MDSPGARTLTPHQLEVLAPHVERIADPTRAFALLGRWAERTPLPSEDLTLLHLAYLAGTSEPLFAAVEAFPRQFHALSTLARQPRGLGREGFEEALGRHLLLSDPEAPTAALAAFRLLQSARILLQDLLGVLPFEAVTRELSCLADALVGRALSLTYQPLRERLGMPQKAGLSGRPLPCALAVFGLGKLGGAELNYSSDVDLVFTYEEDGRTDRGATNGAFFNAWVREAVALLTRPTLHGSCLRVDPNLRPRGRDGELTLAFPAALAYYRDWAEIWERQAWMKARPVAGDQAAGAAFLRALSPLLYRATPSHLVARENRRMRQDTIAQLARSHPGGAVPDLKEGPGGIRDAEFAVQSIQLARGPADPWVREPNTLLALARLRQRGLLADTRRGELARGYLLLRRAEHFVQLQGMRQAHRLPETDAGRCAMARFLGYACPEDLSRALEPARASLTRIFRETTEALMREGGEPGGPRPLDPPALRADLLRAGVRDPDRAVHLLAEAYGVLGAVRGADVTEFHRLLMEECAASPLPFGPVAALHRLLPALGTQLGLLEPLCAAPRRLVLLVRLAALSPALAEMIQRWPDLATELYFESLLGGGARFDEEIVDQASLESIRASHKRALFRFAAGEVFAPAHRLETSFENHTRLAERILASVAHEAAEAVERREGLPPGTLDGGWCLLGLGRLGFGEMHPRSDLDLVVLKAHEWLLPSDPSHSARVEEQLLRALVSGLTGVTRHGALYAVDLRLRPHGESGPPMAHAGSLAGYFTSSHARSWERLAWLKARLVAGDVEVGREGLAPLGPALFVPFPDGEFAALERLRANLDEAAPDLEGAVKFVPGGLLQQDLILLGLQVRHRLPVGPGGTQGLLARLVEAGILPTGDAQALGEARHWMERLLHHLRLTYPRPPGRSRLVDLPALLAGSDLGAGDPATRWAGHRKVVLDLFKRRLIEG